MTGRPRFFGLIVTGKGEAKFLPRFFRTLMARANCEFTVVRRIGQRNPITSENRLVRMVRSGQRLPSKDENEIGLPALRFLRTNPRSFIVLVDDLEGNRRGAVADIFNRYRTALDEVLTPAGLRQRASVHFLVNMLEAYYFADSAAVNSAAGRTILASDHPSDVEWTIGHPKGEIRKLWHGFDEIEDGERVVKALDLDHVLSRPEECAWLRTMFAWCVGRLSDENAIHDASLTTAFCAPAGIQAPLTCSQ